jgi:xanthine/CO dehydrogenase XdhC/CoxF family maturation factor
MALATIVATTGSTYRHAGARLLIPAEGEPIGNISGGCLEGDVARIGREVMGTGQPRLVSFDLTADDDAVWGYGLGCNGSFEIFVEATEGAVAAAQALRHARGLLRTVLTGPEAGTHRFQADLPGVSTPRLVEEDLERVLLEPILPPMHLILCGAGHDAIPLVRQAASLGWRVTVADVRRPFLTHDRFPEASGFLDADPVAVADAYAPDARTSAVVMTHNYLRDIDYLRSLLGHGLAYLGVLGPRRRTDKMLAELAAAGVTPTAADREVLHAPAGLDLGAEGPDEVAWSIVAEMLAVHRGRMGGPLRERTAPIHAVPEPTGSA